MCHRMKTKDEDFVNVVWNVGMCVRFQRLNKISEFSTGKG